MSGSKLKKLNGLLAARGRANLTQDELAFILGVKTHDRISHWEKGRRLPGLVNGLKLEIVYQELMGSVYSELRNELYPEIHRRLRIVLEQKQKLKKPPD